MIRPEGIAVQTAGLLHFEFNLAGPRMAPALITVLPLSGGTTTSRVLNASRMAAAGKTK
jgi:hypothetical protein